jgi:hypothetical protein
LRPVPALAGLAALLIVCGVVLMIPGRLSDSDSPLRSPAKESGVRLLSPVGVIEPAGPVVFEWTAADGASGYEVVVSDPAAGSETVLRIRTRQIRHELTPEERSSLRPGRVYHWLLKIERGVGRQQTTRPLAFCLGEPQ